MNNPTRLRELAAEIRSGQEISGPEMEAVCLELAGLKEQATGVLADFPLPDLPGHPEPWSMKWSTLELQAIERYGKACAAAVLARQGREVLAGYVLVPIEPTEEMHAAAKVSHRGRIYPQDSEHGPKAIRLSEWKAMLSASPALQEQQTPALAQEQPGFIRKFKLACRNLFGGLPEDEKALHDALDRLIARAQEQQARPVDERVRELEEALRQIGDYAHDHSTGPAVPDALWEVRSMAYDAFASSAHAEQQRHATFIRETISEMESGARAESAAQVNLPCGVVITTTVPDGEAHFYQDGKLVGRIVGIGGSDQPSPQAPSKPDLDAPPSGPGAKPLACLIRFRDCARPEVTFDKKYHFGEWGGWQPASLEHGLAVTHPGRNSPEQWQMLELYAAPQPAAPTPTEQTAAAERKECQCTLRQRAVGDGCRFCNPALAAKLCDEDNDISSLGSSD